MTPGQRRKIANKKLDLSRIQRIYRFAVEHGVEVYDYDPSIPRVILADSAYTNLLKSQYVYVKRRLP